jgi:hypothetical protein
VQLKFFDPVCGEQCAQVVFIGHVGDFLKDPFHVFIGCLRLIAINDIFLLGTISLSNPCKSYQDIAWRGDEHDDDDASDSSNSGRAGWGARRAVYSDGEEKNPLDDLFDAVEFWCAADMAGDAWGAEGELSVDGFGGNFGVLGLVYQLILSDRGFSI